MAGAEISADPHASIDHESHKEPDAPSSSGANPKGVPVILRSSLDWETVSTPDATFLGVALVAHASPTGVLVLGGTY